MNNQSISLRFLKSSLLVSLGVLLAQGVHLAIATDSLPSWKILEGEGALYYEGSVGIGTSEVSEGYKLDVAGKIGTDDLDIRENLTVRGHTNLQNVDVKAGLTAASMQIGTEPTPEGFLLSVDGKLIAEEVHVQNKDSSAWPDYVFAEDYQLRSLQELEEYIRENQHLPEVPSAEEVAAEGIGLSEMQQKLLQKVEELTLYVIAQNKRFADFEERGERIKELREIVEESCKL